MDDFNVSNISQFDFIHADLHAAILINFLSAEKADYLYQKALKLAWKVDKLFLFGKKFITKRKVVWISDSNIKYEYSGANHISTEFPKWLLKLKNQICSQLQIKLNSVLGNYYADST